MRELQARYSPYPYVDDTHMFANFGHLGGYSSAYYTYMWSLVIAKDLFSAFDPDDLFDADGRRPLPRPGARARRRRATPPTWSPTSSAGPTPSTRTPPGWRGRSGVCGIPGWPVVLSLVRGCNG